MKKVWKKTLSLLMTLSMVITMMPAVAWAENTCAHVHNAECGYKAAQECQHVCSLDNGCITPLECTHVHGDDCYNCTIEGEHTHGEDCDVTACNHTVCDCPKEKTNCLHGDNHDSTCGYVAGEICNHKCDTECGGVAADEPALQSEQQEQQTQSSQQEPVLMMSPAPAAEPVVDGKLDIANGPIVIEAGGYTQGDNAKVNYSGDYVISQTDAATATANTITVNGIANGKTITLNGVNIKAPDDYPAILIAGDATIRMAANSKNTLTGGKNHPAIEPLNGKTVTVGDAGDGALNVTGGGNETAAIGGAYGYGNLGCNLNGNSRNFGSVIINGGTITATAANVNGSAIGSTRLGYIASVTINGGTIYANNNRAVFASGTDGKAGSVVINGGKIVARNVDNAISTGNNGTITIDSGAVITGGAAFYNKGGTQYDRTQIKIWGTGAEQKNAIVTVTVNEETPFQTETDENGWISYLYLKHNEEYTINITGADNKTYTTGEFTATEGNVVFAKNNNIADYSEKCTMENSSIAFADIPATVHMYDGVATYDVDCSATQSIYAECYAPEHILSYSYEVKQNNAAVDGKTEYAELEGSTLTLKRNGDYDVTITATCGSVTASKIIEVKASSVKALNIANGKITVAEGTTAGTVKYQQGDTTVFDNVAPTDNIIIVGETTTNRIIVQKSAKITLKDVSITISSDERRPMQVLDGATLNLWLEGDNNLTAKRDHGAGIFVEYGSTLVIDSADGTLENADISSEHGGDKQKGYAGSLHVTGATSGCGIGWDYWTVINNVDEKGSGSVTIKGGNVTALGGDNSAPYRSNSGIGAGWYNLEDTNTYITNYPSGDITINGGNVYAGYVGRGGRGISSGSGDLTITGGVVYAYGGGEGHAGSVGAIHSFGGTITIGSENGTDGDLSLYAATTDTVDSGGKAAAIGGANGVDINIVSGTITAESSGSSAAIGGNNSIEGNVGSITISGGNVTTTSKSGENNGTAVGIGVVGDNATCPTIKITGGIVNCENTLIGTNNAENENPIAVTVGKDAEVKIDNSSKGNVTFTFEGGATINETTLPEDVEEIIIPGGSVDQVQGNADGTFTIPAGSVVNGAEIPAEAGTVIVPTDKLVEVKSDNDDDDFVKLPAGTVVAKPDGTTVTLLNGGTVNNEGEISTDKAEAGDTTVTGNVTVNPDGSVDVPAGGSVDVDGEEIEIVDGKVTVNPDGTVTVPEGSTIKQENGNVIEAVTGDVTVDEDGNVIVPAGGVVNVNGKPVTFPDGGTIGTDGTISEGIVSDTGSSSKKSSKKYEVSIDANDVDNGSVKLSPSKAKKGATVTITVTPDEGYKLDKLVVLDKDGNEVELTDKGDGKFTFKMPRGGVEVDASFVEAGAADKSEIVLTIDSVVAMVNGEPVVNDVAPIIKGERTFLPIRLIAEALGATVTWSEADQSVTIVKGDTTIVLYIGQAFALVNGNPVQLDVPAFISNDRTYLPIRFISENLGANVAWDGLTRTVTIIG